MQNFARKWFGEFKALVVFGYSLLVSSLSLAQEATAPAVSSGASSAAAAPPPAWAQFMPLVFMVALFYFLAIRPQQKKEKKRQEFIAGIKRGDEVVTSAGLFGRIEGLNDLFVTLEVADGVRIKVLRNTVASSVQALTQPAAASAAGEKGAKA